MRMQHLARVGSSSRSALHSSILRVVALLVVLLTLVPVVAADASNSGLTSEQVAKEIVRLQGKADRTATAWAEAQNRMEDLSVEIADAQAKVDQTSAAQTQIETQLTNIVVDRFMNGGASSPNIFFSDPMDELQTQALASAVVNQGATSIDDIESVRSELQDQRTRLVGLQTENQQLAEQMSRNQAELETQLAALEVLKAQVVDDETRRAYEAEVAKQRAEEAQQRQDALDAAAAEAAQAAVRDAPLNSVPEPTAPPTTVGSSRSSNSPTAQPVTNPTAPPAVAPLPAAPAPMVTAPEPPAPVLVGGDWLCPVAGPTAFGDSWGDPRSGGRRHQGVDMMSPYGTPLVAVVSGFSTPKVNRLGGNTVSLVGDDGNRYYYAHLSSWEGGARAVAQGDVVGYVGSTGDTSANHLHFEIHPGGGAAVNPYPTVRAHC